MKTLLKYLLIYSTLVSGILIIGGFIASLSNPPSAILLLLYAPVMYHLTRRFRSLLKTNQHTRSTKLKLVNLPEPSKTPASLIVITFLSTVILTVLITSQVFHTNPSLTNLISQK